MNGISGQLFKTPLATYDHTQSCWRMFGDTSVLDSPTFSPTLPVSGSMRNGELFDRPMSERLTGENASMSLPRLPTPTASEDTGPGDHGTGGRNLRTVVDLLPTPRAALGDSRNFTPWIRPASQPQNLENAIAHVIGADTPEQSNNGKQSPGPHPLTLWTIEEE